MLPASVISWLACSTIPHQTRYSHIRLTGIRKKPRPRCFASQWEPLCSEPAQNCVLLAGTSMSNRTILSNLSNMSWMCLPSQGGLWSAAAVVAILQRSLAEPTCLAPSYLAALCLWQQLVGRLHTPSPHPNLHADHTCHACHASIAHSRPQSRLWSCTTSAGKKWHCLHLSFAG